MLDEPKNQFSLTRAASSTGERAKSKFLSVVLLITLTVLGGLTRAGAQGTTTFTYQGQFMDSGTNANGVYTMIFKLYDAVTGGSQIGHPVTTGVTIVNGLFTVVNLDFGASAFTGNARWLDITVTNSSYTVTNNGIIVTNSAVVQTLAPRMQMMPTPYAQFASGAAYAPVPRVKAFGSSGTFIVPTNVTRVMVELWGGGGGGGKGYLYTFSDPPSEIVYCGGGGGSGTYAMNTFEVTPGANYSVIIGSGGSGGVEVGESGGMGGTTAFGNLMSAGGGSGGGAGTYGFGNGVGGDGGVSSNACVRFTGSSGMWGGLGGGTGASAFRGGRGGWGGGTSGRDSGDTPGGGGGGSTRGVSGSPGGGGAAFIWY